eukprot:gene13264-9107_t
MIDSLFDARNYLVVGNFKQAIMETNTPRPNSKKREEVDDMQADKLLIIAQAHIGMHEEELAQFRCNQGPAGHPVVEAVKTWTEFVISRKKAQAGASDPTVSAALSKLEENAAEVDLAKSCWAVFAVSALITVENYTAALNMANLWVSQLSDLPDPKMKRYRMQLRYLVVEALLRINRPELAQDELAVMENDDDESVFTILSQGIVSLYVGQKDNNAETLEQAASYFSNASVRYGQTPMLLNLEALALLALGRLEDAERRLTDAEQLTFAPSHDLITAVNTAVMENRKGKFEASEDVEKLLEGEGHLGWGQQLEKTAGHLSYLHGGEVPVKIKKNEDVLKEVPIEARSVVDFRTATFCGCQDTQAAPSVQRILFQYYQEQFSRIALWGHLQRSPMDGVEADTEHGETKREEEEEGVRVKTEPVEDRARTSGAIHRAYGILTEAQGTVGDAATVPWELHTITHINDEEDYAAAFTAMRRHVPPGPLASWLHLVADGGTRSRADDSDDDLNPLLPEKSVDTDTRRLYLYTKQLQQFTGVYPGMAVGVAGEPCQRSSKGALTGIIVRELFTPHPPVLPWGQPCRGLPALQWRGRSPSISSAARIHFCSGPFPRAELLPLLQEVVLQALRREADLLVIGGPLVPPFGDAGKAELATLGRTFPEVLEGYTQWIEDTLEAHYASRPNVPHLKIVLVSHRDDVTQIPVVPTTMYPMADGVDLWTRSNPCRVSIGGVHLSVCNEDVVGAMQREMLERWPTAEGNLRRVVEAVVQSRCLMPIFHLPSPHVDLKQWDKLGLGYVPEAPATPSLPEAEQTTSSPFSFAMDPFDWQEDEAGAEGSEPSTKRLKSEPLPRAVAELLHRKTEFMPHIVFLPSTRPAFGLLTHRGVVDPTTCTVQPESGLDDTRHANGILVVNPEIWSDRSRRKTFDLRVAEISVLNTASVKQHGVTESNTSCALLHLYRSNA